MVQRYWGHGLHLSRSRDIICHLSIGLAIGVSYRWSIWADRLYYTAFETLSFKDIGIATLTFRARDVIGHVTIGLKICSYL